MAGELEAKGDGDRVGDDGEGHRDVERLRRENALLLALLESASELVDVIARDGTVIRTFRARGRPLGYEPAELEGRNVLELVHPEDVEAARAAGGRLRDAGAAPVQVEVRLRHHDGGFVPMECTIQNRLADPSVRGIVVCSRDVSARIELERKLRLAQRMESVGRVASGIVHDFNNLLSVIMLGAARARLAAASGSSAPRAQELDEIARAAERGATLTKRLLSFVRDRPVRPRVFDLDALVLAQHATLRSLLPDDVQLELVASDAPLPVLADPAELEHVLLNLVLNARDALPQGGTLRITTRLEAGAGADAPAQRAVLEVEDDGQGIDEATRGRLFEPFFTTKSAERGTGLGLWTVQNVISRSAGAIELLSAPGQGTTFRVLLPLSATAAPAMTREFSPVARAPALPGCRVLLVDDEPRLLHVLGAALADAGHTVFTARDGLEALAWAQRSATAPDVLVTDVSMPRLGGRQLAARLRASWPELPVLLVSGHDDVAHDPGERRTALLAKPFGTEELLAAIAALLPSRR